MAEGTLCHQLQSHCTGIWILKYEISCFPDGLSSSEIPETGNEGDSIKAVLCIRVAARVCTEQCQWETIHPAQEVWKYHFDKLEMQQDRSYPEPYPSLMVILCSTTTRQWPRHDRNIIGLKLMFFYPRRMKKQTVKCQMGKSKLCS